MALPPFKTRKALVEDLKVKNKKAKAIVTVTETSWWGWKSRKLRTACRCDCITAKEPEWFTLVTFGNQHFPIPIEKDCDVHELASKTALDMRNMQFTCYEQLLAHRLKIHLRKHHGKHALATV